MAVLTSTAMHAGEPNTLDALTAKARSGDAAAQLDLAYRHRDGKGVSKDDALAMQWAHRAADKGNDEAMDFVGFAHLRGAVVERSPEIAFGYFKTAAQESAAAASRTSGALTTAPRSRRASSPGPPSSSVNREATQPWPSLRSVPHPINFCQCSRQSHEYQNRSPHHTPAFEPYGRATGHLFTASIGVPGCCCLRGRRAG